MTDQSVQNGYYEQAEKIVKMCLMLVTALPTVLLPKVSKAYAENRLEDAKIIYIKHIILFGLGTPLMFGTIGVAPVLVPVFLDKDMSRLFKYYLL